MKLFAIGEMGIHTQCRKQSKQRKRQSNRLPLLQSLAIAPPTQHQPIGPTYLAAAAMDSERKFSINTTNSTQVRPPAVHPAAPAVLHYHGRPVLVCVVEAL